MVGPLGHLLAPVRIERGTAPVGVAAGAPVAIIGSIEASGIAVDQMWLVTSTTVSHIAQIFKEEKRKEIAVVEIEGKKGKVSIIDDEEPFAAPLDKMATLKPAFQRLLLYEAAYGFTSLRTYTHIFIPWLGFLLLDILGDIDQDRAGAASLGDDLKFLFIVSSIEIAQAAEEKIEVGIAEGEKCERCWHVRPDTSADPEHPGICGRCVSNLFGEGEVRNHV